MKNGNEDLEANLLLLADLSPPGKTNAATTTGNAFTLVYTLLVGYRSSIVLHCG
jgi:hypothetical protein